MKPSKFKYFDPETTDEVLALLAEFGTDSRILAGGQTLGPMLNLRVLSPDVIIDINRVKELSFRQHDGSGFWRIGALTRQGELEDDPTTTQLQPLVALALPLIAHRAVRNRGTVGGSLSHSDPSAEWGALVLTLDATLISRSADGTIRETAAKDFHQGLLETALAPDELLVEIRLPDAPKGASHGIVEFSRRHGDLALAGAACLIVTDAEGRCSEARVTLFGVEETPRRLPAVEAMLAGERLDERLVMAAAEHGSTLVSPMSDAANSADYRQRLTSAMIERSIKQAVARKEAGASMPA